MISLQTAPTICQEVIAGVSFRYVAIRPLTTPKTLTKSCRSLQNFSSNSAEYTGSASIRCKPGCVFVHSELDLCKCQSIPITAVKTDLEKLRSGATNATQIADLLNHLRTLNSKVRLFGLLKPKINGPKLSYDDAIQALKYGLQSLAASGAVNQKSSDNIASCIIEIGNVIPVTNTCNSSDAATVAMMVNDATSKLGGRKAVCCQDGSSNTDSCPPGYEASPCKSIQEDSVIWPSTPSGGVAKLSKCKTTFSPHPVVGNLTRTCKKDSDGIFSNWENVDRCACQSIHINSIQERLSRKFAKNYTLAYLNQLASFLYEKWDVVPNRPRPISVLGQIFNIQKRRQLSDATYAAYMNVTACLLNTANALIINTLNGNSECRIDEVQRRHLRILFYQLASNLKSPSFVNQRLGSQEEFTNVNYDTSSVYNEIIQNINYNCVVVGAVVPPAFLNDTILYNVLGIDVIGIGSNTVAPTENITYIGNNTNITNTSFPPSQPIDVHAPILSIITIVGLSFSTVCLVLLVACLIFLRLPRTRKWYIHGNLIAAVISSNVIFLFGADRRYVANNVACTAIAVILHYLFTAVFTWQLAEGVHLYRLLVTIFIKSGRLWIVIYTVIGWIVPAVIVGITAGVAPHAYGGVDACFLTSNFIWFFLGPMAFVVTINVVIFCILIYIIHKKSNFTNKVSNQELNKRQVLKNDLRRAFALLPLLGICWIFIFFVQLRHPIPRYLFTILLSFQGVFVFVFHCIFDQQIMEALRNRNFRFCGSSKRYTSSNSAKKNINSPSLGRSRGVQHPENITSRSSSYTDLHSISQSNNYTITNNGKS